MEFTAPARAILQGSDYYARLNRAALLAFRSKYAITLYEMGCLLAGRRNPTWSGTVDELRERLGTPSNSMPNFSDFRRLVLTPGKAEIDQLAAFTMDWLERRGARGKITHVTITFAPKDDDATDAAADEAERHSGGRRSRREGTTDAIVEAANLIAVAASRLSVSDTVRWPPMIRSTNLRTLSCMQSGAAWGGTCRATACRSVCPSSQQPAPSAYWRCP